MLYTRNSKSKYYKIITSNQNESFLIDLEGNIMNTIFPALWWYYPQKAYKISNEQALALEAREKIISIPALLFIGIIIIFSRFVGSHIRTINKVVFDTSFPISEIMLLLAFIACILLKLYCYYRSKKRLSNIISLEECEQVRIKLLRERRLFKRTIRVLYFYIILLPAILLVAAMYLEYNHILVLIIFLCFTCCYLFSNIIIPPPVNIKDIKIIE
ncbi:MAG: DUF443 family protein [Erysipelotrichaceae bacterium]|nr:DUF443 family protein [Erysipelotrichaceae bacterium]